MTQNAALSTLKACEHSRTAAQFPLVRSPRVLPKPAMLLQARNPSLQPCSLTLACPLSPQSRSHASMVGRFWEPGGSVSQAASRHMQRVWWHSRHRVMFKRWSRHRMPAGLHRPVPLTFLHPVARLHVSTARLPVLHIAAFTLWPLLPALVPQQAWAPGVAEPCHHCRHCHRRCHCCHCQCRHLLGRLLPGRL